MGPPDASIYIDQYLVEPELDEKQILLRRAFVQEYMKSRNAYEACLNLGFMAAYAEDWAKAFMAEGIVRRLIAQAERADDSKDLSLERKRNYRAWMEKQATYYGPGASHSARVAAIAQLMKLEGMEPETKSSTEVVHRGGVMIVPQLPSPDSWGAVAAKSQADLKNSVKD